MDTPEAVRLYESGLTLMEVGLQFGVSQQAVRRAVAAESIEIRPADAAPSPQRELATSHLGPNGRAQFRGRAFGIARP
ncbi:hypothetical protein GCM10011575_00030 [Microlunatus endophyticus]|uniref:Uncharacterized protein n=1 Tax=Microlunatus endophyticus TaxID=1716077 RepID=A0A917RYE5_9ACTN|nr:hypothetical protein [Microlunatus endophyticus]GGL46079.1 hypothetical protein GCM10011575_00030 [Microlunatus endophyticus]